MAIIYIQKNNVGEWQGSNAKDGKAFVTVPSKEQAIQRVKIRKGVTGILIKEYNNHFVQNS